MLIVIGQDITVLTIKKLVLINGANVLDLGILELVRSQMVDTANSSRGSL